MTIKDGVDSGLGDGRERVREHKQPNRKAASSKSGVVDAPMAITSQGDVLVNLTHLDCGHDPIEVVQHLLDEGHEVFVGVVVSRKLRPELQRDLDDALADVVGRLGPQLRRRAR